MKIVILDAQTVSKNDIDLNIFSKYGELVIHQLTSPTDTAERIIDADIVICNKTVLGKNELKMCEELTELQRKAINRANRVRQIRFTPDMMITMNGKSLFTRFGLTITPRMQKKLAYGTKFIKMSFATLGVALIGFKLIIDPSWTVFAEVLMKLFAVVINGFDGRNTGYNNIVIDTVNYTNTQSDLMNQAIQYIDAHPVKN